MIKEVDQKSKRGAQVLDMLHPYTSPPPRIGRKKKRPGHQIMIAGKIGGILNNNNFIIGKKKKGRKKRDI